MIPASWRTTSLGLISILIAVGSYAKAALDNDPTTVPDWASTSAAITAGWGLIMARDRKVSSEQEGLK